MALNNYNAMVAAVDKWINRVGASSVTDNTEDFITLAQRRIMRDVRVPPMEVLVQGVTVTDGQFAIPSAMLDVKEVLGYNGTSAWPVLRDTYTNVRNMRITGDSGPRVFDTVGGNFEFGPSPSSGVSVDIVYYQELEFISPSVPTNWFVNFAPELILYGAIYEAAVFMKDTEQEQKYKQMYDDSRELLRLQKEKAEYSGKLEVNAR